ncbi:hypothetical protein [Streptomyces sp. SAS_270]|uniref:hypothetical protein n=1 Tax=Streptomyces sp. SAS_270 TaxID=3412748 RepID=UPI00403D0020
MPDPHEVSRETIRRLLTGQTVSTWVKVDAVVRALCCLSDQDPDHRRWPESDHYEDDDPETFRQYLRRLWNDDIDRIEPEDDPAGSPAQSSRR